jgi:cephalosporin hydroxylase
MLPGERAALEGVLSALRPSLSIEIGTDKGGSLEVIGAHSKIVHAFDLIRRAEVTTERFPNVTFHTGDSHELLPAVLAQLADAGLNVDFAFVDGNHTGNTS